MEAKKTKFEMIEKTIQSLWQKEFNPRGKKGPDMINISKDECAEHYCQRLIFCDKYKPTLKTKISDYTESDYIIIKYLDKLRMCIIDDIKETPGLFYLVNKLYLQKQRLISEANK